MAYQSDVSRYLKNSGCRYFFFFLSSFFCHDSRGYWSKKKIEEEKEKEKEQKDIRIVIVSYSRN